MKNGGNYIKTIMIIDHQMHHLIQMIAMTMEIRAVIQTFLVAVQAEMAVIQIRTVIQIPEAEMETIEMDTMLI